MSQSKWMVYAVYHADGTVTLSICETHTETLPGQFFKIPLTLAEMTQLHEAITKALWHKIRCLTH